MIKFGIVLAALALTGSAFASWYWPFGDDGDQAERIRLSALMEPATLLIDEAADLASDGKVQASVDKYRAALVELERIERENPERAETMEFATLRNKRAYVNAAIDSLLLAQVRENAKAVAVSDTTELEKRLAAEKKKSSTGSAAEASDSKAQATPRAKDRPREPGASKVKRAVQPEVKPQAKKAAKPLGRREQILQNIADKDYASAEQGVRAWLGETPNNAVALNLLAALEAERGNFKAAEKALDQAIESNPRSHYAYYNMAQLLMDADRENKSVARRYYETGRALGGPEDSQLEGLLK